jgi:transcriptional regulator with XRE-family HTH domain
MEIILKYIGANIKDIRKSRKLTQRELAKKLGVSFQHFNKWENGKIIPNILNIRLIASALGVSLEELLSEKNRKVKDTIDNKNIDLKIMIKDVLYEEIPKILSNDQKLKRMDVFLKEILEYIRKKKIKDSTKEQEFCVFIRKILPLRPNLVSDEEKDLWEVNLRLLEYWAIYNFGLASWIPAWVYSRFCLENKNIEKEIDLDYITEKLKEILESGNNNIN